MANPPHRAKREAMGSSSPALLIQLWACCAKRSVTGSREGSRKGCLGGDACGDSVLHHIPSVTGPFGGDRWGGQRRVAVFRE